MGRSLGLPLIQQLQRPGAAGGSSCRVSVGMLGRVWGAPASRHNHRSSLQTVDNRLPEIEPVEAPDKARLLVAPQRSWSVAPELSIVPSSACRSSAGGSPQPVPPASFSILPALRAAPRRGNCRPERPRSSCIPNLLHCRATPRSTLRHPRSLAQYQETPHQGVGRSRHLESAGGWGLDGSRLQLGTGDQSNSTFP